jgi:hypothetical protein
MDARQFAEGIARFKNNGILTEEVAENNLLYWLRIGNDLRSKLIDVEYMKTKNLDPSYYQTVEYSLVEYDKKSCLYVTDQKLPKILRLSIMGDAVNYIGGTDPCAVPYRSAQNYLEMRNINNESLLRKNRRRYLLDYSIGQGLLLKTKYPEPTIIVRAIFAEPQNVHTFNPTDEYPVPQDFMISMEDDMFRKYARLMFSGIKDRVSNTKNDLEDAARGTR